MPQDDFNLWINPYALRVCKSLPQQLITYDDSDDVEKPGYLFHLAMA